jgi:phosphatidate cytidylyltransferase
MLIQRIVTAVVLLGVLVATLLANQPYFFLAFLSLLVGLTAFEWLRLTVSISLRGLAYAVGLALAAGTFWLSWQWVNGALTGVGLLELSVLASSAIWLIIVPIRLYRAQIDHQHVSVLWSCFAPITLLATFGALALIWLSAGTWSVVSLLALIWIADVAAYFGGRRFGKHKLAAQISPGKTREGALFGLVGVLLWLCITALIDNSYAQALLERWGWLGVVFGAVLLGLLAIMGDLFESYLKRQANVKDSSGLLPGHGGVYDRVDAVVAVVPVAYVLVYGFQI